jgi:hypothetical protein
VCSLEALMCDPQIHGPHILTTDTGAHNTAAWVMGGGRVSHAVLCSNPARAPKSPIRRSPSSCFLSLGNAMKKHRQVKQRNYGRHGGSLGTHDGVVPRATC